MPGAAEFAQTEERISRMTDAELVEMADHAADYEPWALDLGRAELKRRRLEPAAVEELRQTSAAEAAAVAIPDAGEAVVEHVALYVLGLVAFPLYLVLARTYRTNLARKLRFVAGLCIVIEILLLLTFFVLPGLFPE